MSRSSFLKRVSGAGALALAVMLLGGCGSSGPPRYACTGTVTYNGNPVSGATVAFSSPEGVPAVGTTDAQGNFTLEAAAGENKVAITKATVSSTGGRGEGLSQMPSNMAEMTPEQQKEFAAQMQAKMQGMATREDSPAGGSPNKPAEDEIPAKYTRSASSGLTAQVTSDPAANVFKFELTD